MGIRVSLSAFFFLILAVTFKTALTEDTQADDQKRCSENENCQGPDIRAKFLVVSNLIEANKATNFKLKDLMDSTDIDILENVKVNLNCSNDKTLTVRVNIDGVVTDVTSDTLISLADDLDISVLSKRDVDVPVLYKCRVKTLPGKNGLPVKIFILVAVIVPDLQRVEVIPKKVRITNEQLAARFELSDLLDVKMPSAISNVNEIVARVREEYSKEMTNSKEVTALIEQLTNVLNEYQNALQDVELLFTSQKIPDDITLTFAIGKTTRSLNGTKIKVGKMRVKPVVYIEKPVSFIGPISIQVKAFSKFIIIKAALFIQVEKINFPPFLKTLDPILFQTEDNSYEFQWNTDVSKLFSDKNKGDIIYGVILFASSDVAGNWQYQDSTGSWKNVSLKPDLTSDGKITVNAIVLSIENKFRFLPAASLKNEMKNVEALRKCSIFFTATDGFRLEIPDRLPAPWTVTLSLSSSMILQYSGRSTAFSHNVARVYVNPRCSLDCDQKKVCGKPISDDACPECPNGKRKNKCTGTCYGPQEHKKKMEGKDCRGECDTGSFILYDIPEGGQICLRKGLTPEHVAQEVCLNIYNGQINRCGKCYGGNTTKDETEGMDRCGKCNGDGVCDNSCDGVPNGPNIIDSCGQCVNPKSRKFNSKPGSEIQLGKIEPAQVTNICMDHTVFRITGCNLHLLSKNAKTCMLKKGAAEVSLRSKLDKKWLLASTNQSTVDPGVYSLDCKLPKAQDITVTVVSVPSKLTVTPTSINTSEERDVTICGSGSSSYTGKLKCVMTCPFHPGSRMEKIKCISVNGERFANVDATVADSGCVRCHSADIFKRLRYPGEILLTVLQNKQEISCIKKLPQAELKVIAPAPELMRVEFLAVCELRLVFTSSITGPPKPDGLFEQRIQSRLEYVRNVIVISLKKGHNVQPNDEIRVKGGVLKQPSTESVFSTPNAPFTFTVPYPERRPTLKIRSAVQGNLTLCQENRLFAAVQGVGSCVDKTFQWSVSIEGDTVDKDFTKKVESIRKNSLKISKKDLLPGKSYEIKVNMRTPNFLEAVFNTKREDVKKNFSVELFIPKFVPKRNIKVKAVVDMLCSSSSPRKEKIDYRFKLRDAERNVVSYSTSNKEYFRIPFQKLVAGGTYVVSVKASSADEEDEDEKKLYIPILPMEMRIEYDSTINVDKPFKLKAKLTNPNNNKGPPIFSWTCFQEMPPRLQLCPRKLSEISKNTSTDSLTVPSSVLEAGKTYRFVVIATIGRQEVSANATVKSAAVDPPKVRLSPKKKVKRNKIFPMYIRVRSKDPVNITFSCSLSDADGMEVDCDNFTDKTIPINKGNVMKKFTEMFALINAGKHTIHCYVQSVNNPELSTTASLQINVIPELKVGALQVDKKTGMALQTTFTLDIENEDDDKDITYQLRYKKKDQQDTTELGIPFRENNGHKFKLPAGRIKLEVEGCTDGFCTSQSIGETFIVDEISPEELNSILESITDEDLVDSFVTNENGSSGASGDNVKKRMKEAGKNICDEISSDDPEESSANMKNRVNKILDIVEVDDGLKTSSKKAIKTLLRNQATDSRRKKRSLNPDPDVQPLSLTDAQTLLVTLTSIYKNVSESDISQSDSEDFITDLETITYRLCAHDDVNAVSDPLHLKTADVVLKVNELPVDVDGFAMVDHNMTCTDCPEFNNHTATVRYGKSITDELSLWNCTDELTCNSACFVSGLLKKDYLYGTMDSREKLDYNLSARASHVYHLKAYNPETFVEMTLPFSEKRMDLTFPVVTSRNELMSHSLKCHGWIDQAWSVEPCTSDEPMLGLDGMYKVRCSCVGTGYFTVIKEYIDESISTTTNVANSTTSTMSTSSGGSSLSSSTSESESITSSRESGSEGTTSGTESATSGSESSSSENAGTTSDGDSPSTSTQSPTTTFRPGSKAIKIRMDATLSQIIGNGSLADFKTDLRGQIAERLSVKEQRIQILDVYKDNKRKKRSNGAAGYTIVSFVVVASASSSDASVDDLENQLRNAISTGNFTLTDASGNSVLIDPAYFQSVLTGYVSGSAEPEKKRDLLGIIIGAVLGGLCLILIVVIIFAVLKMKKRSIVDDTPSPPVTPTSSYSDNKLITKPYLYGVSASPLPEKPGVERSTGGGNHPYVDKTGKSPSIITSRDISPTTNANSLAKLRSSASLSREGTSVSHGSYEESSTKEMPRIE